MMAYAFEHITVDLYDGIMNFKLLTFDCCGEDEEHKNNMNTHPLYALLYIYL